MKRSLCAGVALLMAVGLAAMISCGGSGGGGGGNTPASTVSKMAGKWTTIFTGGGGTVMGSVTIDKSGNVTRYVGFVCPSGRIINMKGSFTQTGGKIQYQCPTYPANEFWVEGFKLRFVNDNRLQGSVTFWKKNIWMATSPITMVRK